MRMKARIAVIEISQTVHGILLTKTAAFKVLRSVCIYFADKMKTTDGWIKNREEGGMECGDLVCIL